MRLIFISLVGFLVSCSGCRFDTEVDLPFAALEGMRAACEVGDAEWTQKFAK